MSWPLPGLGAFAAMAPGSPGEGVVVAFPAQPLLNEGIALSDAPKWFEQEGGRKFPQEQGAAVRILPKQYLWIPFGWVAVPVIHFESTAEAEEVKKGTSKKDAEQQSGFMVHIPFLERGPCKGSQGIVRQCNPDLERRVPSEEKAEIRFGRLATTSSKSSVST